MEELKNNVIGSINTALDKETLDVNELNVLTSLLNVIVNAPVKIG